MAEPLPLPLTLTLKVLITGVGYVTPWVTGSGEIQAPEITGFEVPEGRPAFGFELPDFELETYVPSVQTFVDRTSALGLAAGKLITLPTIETEAVTLAPRRSAEINLEIIRDKVDQIVLVSDEEMRTAARWLWFEMGVGAELSGAAAIAAIQAGKVDLPADSTVAAVICGVGDDGIGG